MRAVYSLMWKCESVKMLPIPMLPIPNPPSLPRINWHWILAIGNNCILATLPHPPLTAARSTRIPRAFCAVRLPATLRLSDGECFMAHIIHYLPVVFNLRSKIRPEKSFRQNNCPPERKSPRRWARVLVARFQRAGSLVEAASRRLTGTTGILPVAKYTAPCFRNAKIRYSTTPTPPMGSAPPPSMMTAIWSWP